MNVNINLLEAGYCTHIKKISLRTAPWHCCKFPAKFALIQHPDIGNILFDTGYSDRFFKETRIFPFQIYRWITPVSFQKEDSAISQLSALNIKPEDIDYIFISHFHADHIGALRDFKKAKFIFSLSGFNYLKKLGKFSALRAGFIKNLLPDDFEQRMYPVENCIIEQLPQDLYPFNEGYNLFDNKDLYAIELPGHAHGQFGLCIRTGENRYVFFVGDACWHSEAFKKNVMPHWLANFIMANKKEYGTTLAKLNSLYANNTQIDIIPSHCTEQVSFD
jgi:glyoxylase-like metal-dependent hydrolase (beta-lactamase superfamily II)